LVSQKKIELKEELVDLFYNEFVSHRGT
jgi:hypothetical protein